MPGIPVRTLATGSHIRRLNRGRLQVLRRGRRRSGAWVNACGTRESGPSSGVWVLFGGRFSSEPDAWMKSAGSNGAILAASLDWSRSLRPFAPMTINARRQIPPATPPLPMTKPTKPGWTLYWTTKETSPAAMSKRFGTDFRVMPTPRPSNAISGLPCTTTPVAWKGRWPCSRAPSPQDPTSLTSRRSTPGPGPWPCGPVAGVAVQFDGSGRIIGS